MREEVMVLPPAAERRKSSMSMSKKEENREAVFNNTNRKWVLSEGKSKEKIKQVVVISRDLKAEMKVCVSDLASSEKMKESCNGEHDSALPLLPEEKANGEDGSGTDGMMNFINETHEDCLQSVTPMLQWGHRKRNRCNRVDNHHPKPCSLADEASVLSHKISRIHMDKVSVVALVDKPKNGVVRKRECPWSLPLIPKEHEGLEGGHKRATVMRGGALELRREKKRLPVEGGRRGYVLGRKQDSEVYQSKTRTSPDHKLASPDKSGKEACCAKTELTWPKFVMSLSRKEKEEDFLIFKGTKLPQRPKRRPKAVEKIFHYCTPGNWLTDLSHSRYDVREKKCIKRKPRGLKAMESMDTDSD